MQSRTRDNGEGTLFQRSGKGNWIASWYDHAGKRCTRSTRTTCKATAQRILCKQVSEAALRREGVVDPAQDLLLEHSKMPLQEHLEDYLAHCKRAGQGERTVNQKRSHYIKLIESTSITHLSGLNARTLERYLATLQDAGKSARTWNFVRQQVLAFANWCVKQGRWERHALNIVPRLDEQRDRRRKRRALTSEELSCLIDVARLRGRASWYMAAALAGLRKGELKALKWADVNFQDQTLTIREGKAKRIDVLPMHKHLSAELTSLWHDRRPLPTANVFPTAVTDTTRKKDFKRAGIALVDEEGRVADLHALRTTLGTQLARAGVTPQAAQRMMRHSDYRTTLKHYTVLGLSDTFAAIDQVPGIGAAEVAAKTGTDTPSARSAYDSNEGAKQGYFGASECEERTLQTQSHGKDKPRSRATLRDDVRGDTPKRVKGIEPSTFSLGS